MTHTPTDAVLTRNQKREEAAIALGRSLTIGWSDIMAYASVYPQHERRALAEIVWLLGYLPQQNIIIPHEVFIRTLIEQRDTGMITEDEFVGGVLTHVTHIRNDDMNKHGWSNICNPTKEEYRRYSNTLTDYKNRVSDKVEKFFGEVP
ncbi:MAG: hypothetical protein JNM91_05320, partial [Flavobacteriales bacterium]|nr:hypothetical protein [Flavobacteriales bacterium]